MEDQMTAIYEKWHEYAKTRQTEALASLYDENAIFESPLVPRIMNREKGVLRGRKEIKDFLEEGTKRRPNELVKWYRTGNYLIKGNMLIWEYPRQTPNGDQVDILELMEIENGQIACHRIYWGWFGTEMLIKSATGNNQER